jgi:hypothetical protein
MSYAIKFSITFVVCVLLGTSAFAFSKRPVDVWVYYHFDGIGFKPGQTSDSSPYIAVRDNVKPMVLVGTPSRIDAVALPSSAGVIAGICYFQSSGGKLGDTIGYTPCPLAPLQISSGGKQFVTVKTDEYGYFVVELEEGNYLVGSGPFTAEITVERGVTTLVPLRAGKRMVD